MFFLDILTLTIKPLQYANGADRYWLQCKIRIIEETIYIPRCMRKTKKWSMTRWRKKCVDLAKKIIKIRDKFTCQRCMKKVEWVNCQWSHVIPESKNKKLSCDLLNIKVLCYRCHKLRRHLAPLEGAKRFKRKFPLRLKHLESENKKTNGSIGKQYFIDKHEELKEIYKWLLEE